MQIRKRLQINVAVLAVIALVIALVLAATLREVSRSREESEIAGEIAISALERAAFREDYLQTNRTVFRDRWFAKNEDIRGLLETADRFRDAEDRKLLQELARQNRETVALFSTLVENREKASGGQTERKLVRLLNTGRSEFVLKARALSDTAERRLSRAIVLATWTIMGMVAFLIVAAAVSSWSLSRLISSRVYKLRSGATIIGEGDLYHRIDVTGDDEFADLARTFNVMTEKLSGSYRELENEIEERLRTEEELRLSEQRLRATFDKAGVGLVEVDQQDRFIAVNDRICEILGCGREELLGMSVHELTAPGDRSRSDDLNARLHQGQYDRFDYEKRYLRCDGTPLWVHVTVSAVRDAGGRHLRSIATVEDIDKRKQAEQERERLLSEVQRSNLELEQFAYVASHDLQEPLRMVASYVQLLEQKYRGRLDEKADKYIHFAVDGATRMQKLIEGLLAYSRIGRRGGEFRKVDANRVYSLVLANLAMTIRENHAVIGKDDLPDITGDETQLVQLFQNLISNGIKYRKPDQAPKIQVSAKRDGNDWVFSVRDNGIGIEPRHFDRVFQIFQRLHSKSEYPGTGIGLALCKRIVERHHGRIWVESTPGEGSTFFFTVPA